MTSTAHRPEAAARRCSQARWRQPAEHHFGIGPFVRGVMAPPHQPHDVDATRLATLAADPFGTDRCSTVLAERRAASRRRRSRARSLDRYSALPRLPMPAACGQAFRTRDNESLDAG